MYVYVLKIISIWVFCLVYYFSICIVLKFRFNNDKFYIDM